MFWFDLEALLIACVVAVVAAACAVRSVINRHFQIAFGITAAYFLVTAGFIVASVDAAGLTLRDIDFRMALPSMTDAIDGPTERADMYRTRSGAFFLRWTFFSPDPYCGYEFTRTAGDLDLDPLGSGQGAAEPLGVPGWYWVCAS